MNEQEYIITFDGVSADDANRYAEELRQTLLDVSSDVKVQRRRDDPHAQDFGATLLIILAAPATATIITALGNWLALRLKASITIKTADGETVVQNISSKNAVELAKLSLSKK